MALLTLVLLQSCLLAVAGNQCPDLTVLRSDEVKEAFDPHLLQGVLYQQAYIDIAEIGARCPVMTTTFEPSTGVISTRFKVDYGPIPFTIVENYYPRNSTGPHKSRT